jgi:alpha-1,2-mannosyltransferase
MSGNNANTLPITGFHASTEEQFAAGFAKALELPSSEALAMRLRSRESAKRFSEEVFSERWLNQLDALVELEKVGSK